MNQLARVMWADNADLDVSYAKAVEQVDVLQELLEKAVKEHELHRY